MRERGGGFVHDDDAGLVYDGAADGGELPVGDGQRRDVGVEVEVQAQLVDDTPRRLLRTRG